MSNVSGNNLVMFSVYDTKVSGYLAPFFLQNANVAKRTFSDCANDPNHLFSAHPQDFILFEIGTFDSNTGFFTPHEKALNHGNALQYKNPEAPLSRDDSDDSSSVVKKRGLNW